MIIFNHIPGTLCYDNAIRLIQFNSIRFSIHVPSLARLSDTQVWLTSKLIILCSNICTVLCTLWHRRIKQLLIFYSTFRYSMEYRNLVSTTACGIRLYDLKPSSALGIMIIVIKKRPTWQGRHLFHGDTFTIMTKEQLNQLT